MQASTTRPDRYWEIVAGDAPPSEKCSKVSDERPFIVYSSWSRGARHR